MIFRGFRVFEYGLWQKTKIRKRRKSTESFVKQRFRVAKNPPISYVSTILALKTGKTTFEHQG